MQVIFGAQQPLREHRHFRRYLLRCVDVQQLNHRLIVRSSYVRERTRKGNLHDWRDQPRHGRGSQVALLPQ